MYCTEMKLKMIILMNHHMKSEPIRPLGHMYLEFKFDFNVLLISDCIELYMIHLGVVFI